MRTRRRAAGAHRSFRRASASPEQDGEAGGASPSLLPSGHAAGVAALESLEATDQRPEGPVADRVVLVHDGARPFVSVDLIEAVAAAAAAFGAAIPVLPVAETLKRIEAGRVAATLDRSTLATAQTPQGFRRSVLRAAYAQLDPAGPVTSASMRAVWGRVAGCQAASSRPGACAPARSPRRNFQPLSRREMNRPLSEARPRNRQPE